MKKSHQIKKEFTLKMKIVILNFKKVPLKMKKSINIFFIYIFTEKRIYIKNERKSHIQIKRSNIQNERKSHILIRRSNIQNERKNHVQIKRSNIQNERKSHIQIKEVTLK